MQTLLSAPTIDTLNITSYQVVPEANKITVWYCIGYMELLDDPGSTLKYPLPQINTFHSVEAKQLHIVDTDYTTFFANLIGGLQSEMLDALYAEVTAIL